LDGNGRFEFKKRLTQYFRLKWNYLDIFGCGWFAIGIFLRYVSFLRADEHLFKLARIILCQDVCIWFLRLLHVSLVYKSLGPKLVMIENMIRDLLFFLCLMAIFVFAYGITTEAILNQRSELDLNLFRRIVNKAYWPIYGTIKVMEDFDKINFSCHEGSCPESIEKFGAIYSFLLLMAYMIIANVLLVNLLIAMFRLEFRF
jgi:hypothetical protein